MRSLLKKGDKLRRIADGKMFVYVGPDDSDNENYGHVEEMLVPVYLPNFEKVNCEHKKSPTQKE